MSLKGSAESYIELKGSISLPKAIQGKSAYEIALLNGFEGTETEWLASLAAEANKIAMESAELARGSATSAETAEASAKQHEANAKEAAERAEQYTEEHINKWLEENPEATTTVQEHSLTVDNMVVGTLGYVSPEMFGAVGDGVADDTTAVQNAVNANGYVLMNGKYKTTAPIVFPSRVYCVLNGMVNYTGGDSAVVLGGSAIKITGTGEVRSTGNSCLRVSGDTLVANCVVEIFRMYCYGTAGDVILLECSDPNYSVCMNLFANIILQCENYAYNGVHIKTSGSGYVNENTFDGLVYQFTNDAIKITNNSTQWPVDGNKFLRVEGETARRQICVTGGAYGALSNIFELRTNEIHSTDGVIHISAPFRLNEIRINCGISAKCFDVSNGDYDRNSLAAEMPSNRLTGSLTVGGATVSVNPTFAISGSNLVFKHTSTVGGCSSYLNSPYVVDYDKGVTGFPNQEIYLMNVSNTEISDVVFDMNGRFGMRANFPFKILLPYTEVGKARFTLKDGDTVHINAEELETYNMYMVYVLGNGTYSVRKI